MTLYEVRVETGVRTIWEHNRKFHHVFGPAVILSNGEKKWFLGDELHREGGPAIEMADGTEFWFRNGLRHREDGPAMQNMHSDLKAFYLNGKLLSEKNFYGLVKNSERVCNENTSPQNVQHK